MYIPAVLLAVVLRQASAVSQEVVAATLANTPPDTLLTFPQLAAKYGYPAETHYVTTEDGYILALDRIPGNTSRLVVCNHGVFDTGDGWIIRGNRSLALVLAQAGYEVWAINFRGNRYSRNHTTLNPDTDIKFWEFDEDDLGNRDLSATIDYILKLTGQERLSVVGFSQGTTATFILTSSQPAYNDKIKTFVALAPIVYLTNVKPLLSIIIQFSQFLNFILPQNYVELVGYNSLLKAVINLLCTQTIIGYDLCYQAGFNSVSGADRFGIGRDFFPIIIGHFPAGQSRKSLLHYAQIGLRKTFAKYDYGPAGNLRAYRSFSPPEYDLSKVSVPVVLISGRTDSVSTLEDVTTLKNKLSNVETFIVNSVEYNHLDHLWAYDAYEKEYVFVLDRLNKYNT